MAESARSRPHSRPVPSPLRIWLSWHIASAASGVAWPLRKPLALLLTVSAMALAFSLPLGLWLVLGNLEQLSGSVQEAHAIDLFLTPGIADERAQGLAQQLRNWDGVAAVEQQTPQQAWEELSGRQGWSEINSGLLAGENPLPYRLRVIPQGDAGTLLASFEALAEVDLLQHDAIWRQRLEDWLNLGRRLLWVLGALFGAGALLVVGNGVRLDIQTRGEEIQVLHLLGAGNGFIRRPFLYLGAWYGLLAGAFAIGILAGAGASVHGPLSVLAENYHSRFALRGFGALEMVQILAAGTVLGWLGARLVSGHLLRRLRTA